MSRYEWERGEFKLPSAEFAKVRQAFADADMKRKKRLFELSQELWQGLTAKEKADPAAYTAAVEAFERKHSHGVRSGWGSYSMVERVSDLPDGFNSLVRFKTFDQRTQTKLTKPKRVLKEDMEFPTNRTLSFSTDNYGATAHFDKASNTLRWDVDENNHAVDYARKSDLGKALFAALNAVRWSRSTGGQIRGNNEYHSDPDNYGDGAHYISHGFGPIGAAVAPYSTDAYTMADGKRVRPEDFPARVRDRADVAKAVEKERKQKLAALERAKKKAAAAAAGGPGVNRIAKGEPGKAGRYTFGTHTESSAPPLSR